MTVSFDPNCTRCSGTGRERFYDYDERGRMKIQSQVCSACGAQILEENPGANGYSAFLEDAKRRRESEETSGGLVDLSDERGAAAAPERPASPATNSQVIPALLANGWPNMHPELRAEQLRWARAQLYRADPITPYRTIVACRVLEFLSQDAAERDAARVIKQNAEEQFQHNDKPVSWTFSEPLRIGAHALFFGIITALVLVLP